MAWATFNFCKHENVQDAQEILNQMMWFNSEILCNKRPYVYEPLCQSGIRYIKDINLEDENSFLAAQEITNKFAFVGNFLVYYRLVNRIPEDWKRCLQIPSYGGRMLSGLIKIIDVLHVSKFI